MRHDNQQDFPPAILKWLKHEDVVIKFSLLGAYKDRRAYKGCHGVAFLDAGLADSVGRPLELKSLLTSF